MALAGSRYGTGGISTSPAPSPPRADRPPVRREPPVPRGPGVRRLPALPDPAVPAPADPDELRVLFGNRQAVGLARERRTDDLGPRILRGQPVQDRVVGGDRDHISLL